MIIGIAGPSRSGKTTLASLLAQHLSSQSCVILSQDKFVLPEKALPRINNVIDWENPEGLDFDRLKRVITEEELRHDIVIVEGFLLFYDKEILKLFDKTIFIQIDKQIFLNRKAADKRWGNITSQYIDHIWESHTKNGKIRRDQVDIFLDGTDVKKHLNAILYLLKKHPSKTN